MPLIKWLKLLTIWSSIILSASALGKQQVVSANLDTSVISPGDQVKIEVIYTSSNEDLTTGLGLNIHYDSSKLLEAEVVNILDLNNLGSQFGQDIKDLDTEAATDELFSANWADFGGKWPLGKELPVTLFTIIFRASEDFTDTVINFSKNTGAAGYNFSAGTILIKLDPLSLDNDGDGLSNGEEIAAGTNPDLSDTDGDGTNDKLDDFPLDSNEAKDTDSDGIGNNSDTDDDGDGVSDAQEVIDETNPLVADTDGDGLLDGQEATNGTNPLLSDTDGDGFSDGDEVNSNTDPLDANSIPRKGLPIWLLKAAKDKMEQDATN